ncbi:MAG: lipoate--protein ligase [Verrucomicrobia bacterium]|nr:MAG: lipoate--protein ligase [Verrucomicrobiota bacterium]
MLIVESQSLDVHRNLAIEEYLMERVVDRGPVLFLWRSDCAVVMGKNQNPWRECRLGLMRAEKVPLARRISGGGTVYHDAGNLNYCVIVDRTQYREEQAYEMVLNALEAFGIHAEKTGKSNLSVNGFKFSGNAFCFRKGRALHHGTLLLNTDLERLTRYLGCLLDQIETHAIRSVPAEVANLALNMEEMSEALRDSFRFLYGDGSLFSWTEAGLADAELLPLLEKQRSDEWKYGATPRFAVEQDGLRLEVAKGMVVSAEGVGAESLLGKPFLKAAVSMSC